jgi:hypothetical protein
MLYTSTHNIAFALPLVAGQAIFKNSEELPVLGRFGCLPRVCLGAKRAAVLNKFAPPPPPPNGVNLRFWVFDVYAIRKKNTPADKPLLTKSSAIMR